ncbi:MAG: hypothetical protein HQK76_20755 [Desulfobacterales bacterium]|nr:hypothetical protein [Desulfobacterales bacterium]
MTNNIKVLKSGGFGSSNFSNCVVFNIGNNVRDSLFEDIWAYGFGRKALQAFGCMRIKIRRAVVRYDYWDGSKYKPNDPRPTFSGYNTHDSIFENVIALDSAPNPPDRYGDQDGIVASGNETPVNISGSRNNKYLGSISLDNFGNGIAVSGGSGEPTTEIYFKDMISWGVPFFGFNISMNDNGTVITNTTIGMAGLTGIRFDPYPQYPILNEKITQCFVYNCKGNGYYYQESQMAQFENNTGYGNSGNNYEPEYAPAMKYFLKPEMKPGKERGAEIIYRYVDGVLTDEHLWPWPFEDLIHEQMCNADDLAKVHRIAANGTGWEPGWCKSGKSLTKYLWEYLGNPMPPYSEIYRGSPSPNPFSAPISILLQD